MSEVLTTILVKEFVDKTGSYILRHRRQCIDYSLEILKERGVENIYKKLERLILKVLDIERLKLMFHINQQLYVESEGEFKTFNETTDSILTFAL